MTVRRLPILLLVLIVVCLWRPARVGAEVCDTACMANLQKQIDDFSRARELSEKATRPLEAELNKLEAKLRGIESQIGKAGQALRNLETSIDGREKDLAVQYQMLATRVRDYYKRSRFLSPLSIVLSSGTAANITRELAFRQVMTNQDKLVIVGISRELLKLDEDKQTVEEDRKKLAAIQAQVDKEAAFFRKEVKGAKAYQQQLSSQIAELSARQQAILSEKAGTFQTTVGDVPLADDPASRPDYNPGFSPAFAAFSFGAPHFKGMSQYGAFGRAKSGQTVEQILRAYYGDGIEIKKDYPEGINISVQGYDTVGLETYVKRIYEMPLSWGDEGGMEALKAQAVAARSYGLAYTDNGARPICATEACQVYKPSDKGGKWNEAVEATKGWVLMAGGKPFSAWYASTSGGYQLSYNSNGYSTPGFWDTPSGRSGWTSQAYEKVAESPWFYKGWYKSRGGDSCGRSHPWLTSEEMADILNAWVVLFQGSGDASRVTPADTNCWGGSPYSKDELRSIGGFSSVGGVTVTYAENGVTAGVNFQTNKGNVAINGADFKKAFNLRAPGRIALKSNLFNIEKK